ncbi:unnamed protein product [Closterium sp. NIES-53]
MTTLRVLLHGAAQRDYELHSLDFSTAFLQGNLHEEIWLRRPPSFTGSFPAALGFTPTADPSLFLRTNMSLPPFYVLIYGYTFSLGSCSVSWRSTRSSSVLSFSCEAEIYAGAMAAQELRWLTYLLTDLGKQPHLPPQRGQLRLAYMATRANTADIFTKALPPGDHQHFSTALGLLALFFLTGLVTTCSPPLCRWGTSGMGLVLGGRGSVVLTRHSDASWADDRETQSSSQGYTFTLGSGYVSWRSSHSSSVLGSSCEAEIYAGAMAAQELRWLTYLLIILGEQPCSPPVLCVDNKAMLALCHEQRLEHRTKHIALRYFLARELQQRGQLCLSFVASRANTADIFTKALGSGDHQRFCSALGLVPTLPHLLCPLVPSRSSLSCPSARCACCRVAPAVPSRRVALAVPSPLLSRRPCCPVASPLRSCRVTSVPSRRMRRACSSCRAIRPDLSCRVTLPVLSRRVVPARLVQSVLPFEAEGRPLEFSVLLLRARRLLQSQAHFILVCTASESLTTIKARYTTPTTVSLGRLFLPFLFPGLASFECSADLIAHLRSLDSSYRGACTDAQLALLPPPVAITIYFIATSLPGRLALVRDALFLKHPSELTIEVLESVLKDVERSLQLVASASGDVSPPLFHRCTVSQLPTFTASLAIDATDMTAAAVTTSSLSRGRSGRRGGQCVGGGGGGGVASGGGGSTEVGGATRAAASDSPAAAGGGELGFVRHLLVHQLHVLASHQAAASHQVAVYGQVPVSCPIVASCSCQSLAHPTVLWHHHMGHPSIPRLRTMSSQCLVLGLPRVLPSLPPSLAPPCGPYVEGRLRATPHSSSLRPATEPFETLHLDVLGPAPRPGPGREIFFLVVIDDYSRYTTVFLLAKNSEVTSMLIRWLLTTVDTSGRRISFLHSDREGGFRSDILAGFCHEQGIRQSWTLPESPQQNGVVERRIGLVMEIARTSMIHAQASPSSLWTGSPGVASRFRVWGCLALDSSDFTFYHPPLHRFFDSCDVCFVESVPYYTQYPCRGLSVPPPPLFLTLAPPPAPPVQPPPLGPALSDPGGAGARVEDPRGATSGGVGVGAETMPTRGLGAGGAGVGDEPTSAGGSSLRGAGVGRAVLGGARTGGAGAPSTGPGESGTGRIAAGGAGSRAVRLVRWRAALGLLLPPPLPDPAPGLSSPCT